VINNGVYDFTDSAFHQFVYELKDVSGNTSKLTGVLKSSPNMDTATYAMISKANWVDFDQNNEFKADGIELYFKKGSFYRSFDFKYEVTKSPVDSYSKLHKIQTRKFPVHKAFEIRINPDSLAADLQKKALIARIADKEIEAVGGAYKDGFVVGSSASFGDFTIVVDKHISFEIEDEFSGISSYRGTLNGKWILMEYDPKNDKLIYQIDDRMKKGKNQIRLEVKDAKENLAVFEAEIEY
jgi:hypothetical protein